MPRRSFRPSGRPRVRRRKLVWARDDGVVTVPSAAAPALAAPARINILNPFFVNMGASLVGCTIMRIRGYIWCLGINAVRQQVRAVMWIGDSNDALRAPNANDNPFDDISSSKDFFGVYPLLTSSVVEEQLMPITGAMVDVKSSRKLEELNQVLLIS